MVIVPHNLEVTLHTRMTQVQYLCSCMLSRSYAICLKCYILEMLSCAWWLTTNMTACEKSEVSLLRKWCARLPFAAHSTPDKGAGQQSQRAEQQRQRAEQQRQRAEQQAVTPNWLLQARMWESVPCTSVTSVGSSYALALEPLQWPDTPPHTDTTTYAW